MPIYDYECRTCGSFRAYRSMVDYAKPAVCDGCGTEAPRAIRSAPALATMDAGRRKSIATNEKSQHEPRRWGGAHPAGCGCCGPKKQAAPAKSFPGARPWMISH